MPIGTSSSGVAYGNSVYVSIVNNNLIYTSANGTAWSKVADASVPSSQMNRITFAAGVFVVVGNSGLIATSTDGVHWTTRTSGTTNTLNDIQFLQSNFYAVGNNATLLTSATGTTWTAITMGSGSSTDMFMNITYGNGYYVVGSRNSGAGNTYIYRSATAASGSWNNQQVSFQSINKVQYLKNKFFIFMSSAEVYTSTDGGTWTNSTTSIIVTLPNSTTTNIGSPNQVFNGFYDGTKIYLFGSSQYYGGYGSVYSSTDGVNFTLQARTAYIVCQGSAYINNKYFQYGNEGVVSSTDGVTYTYPGGSYNSMASSGTSYVGVGSVGGTAGVVFTSTDFNTFTEKTPANQKELYGVVYDGSKYIAAGNQTVIQSTDNGNSWTSVATPAYQFYSLGYGASRLVAAGTDLGGASVIAYSSNGSSWISANTANNWYFKVKYVNNTFFALGYSNVTNLGVIMKSTDGITWADITPTLSFPVYYFNDVIYDGSKYHFMGMEYDDPVAWTFIGFFSVSTATITNPGSFTNKGTITSPPGGAILGGTWGEGAFAYSNGHIVGAVNDVNTNANYVIYSSDGISYTATTTGETTAIYGNVASGSTFNMMGTGDGKITVAFSSTLPVTLTQFTGSLVNAQSLLKWQTASESNSRDFAVQYSIDGVHWTTVGTVAAAGTSNSIRQYQFTHANPVNGDNFYRLAQEDIDGKQQLSSIIKLHLNGELAVRIYPTPVISWLQIELTSDQPATVNVYDTHAQRIYHKMYSNRVVRVPLQHLPSGVYILEVNQNGHRFAQSITKL